MSETKPRLVWVGSKADEYEQEGYLHPDLDRLLNVPGTRGYIGRGLHFVRGNRLRGRKENADTINIWYLDPDVPVTNLTTNQTVHGTQPTLIGDTWGETIFKGPMVIVVKEGSAFDPRRIKDVTLTAYRDAIDFLGYYIETNGSMIDGIGAETMLAQRVIAESRAGKTTGWRINCRHDRVARGLGDMMSVAVPRAHPLFRLEGDDPLDIPGVLGFEWVMKVYDRGGKDETGLENEMARLLLPRATARDGKWEGIRNWINSPAIGSVLLVERQGREEIKSEVVKGICILIRDVVVPLMTEERALRSDGRREIVDAVRAEGKNRSLFDAIGARALGWSYEG
ncbi:hypothetical protein TGAM01_v211147 [Trichoderma gamsii]|uniref:Uncharacterized protein n=1 Tax=Trichoderma gamsii TaxID=398673 RepID=A0A2P4Z6S2_9HYPO|nr:hypothetical protein TGAM01_v211147 [Trichoderma gamsii]PON19987.1 hypothetical protein TGAM01_v211147 [Trichoderma gamsii]